MFWHAATSPQVVGPREHMQRVGVRKVRETWSTEEQN